MTTKEYERNKVGFSFGKKFWISENLKKKILSFWKFKKKI